MNFEMNIQEYQLEKVSQEMKSTKTRAAFLRKKHKISCATAKAGATGSREKKAGL